MKTFIKFMGTLLLFGVLILVGTTILYPAYFNSTKTIIIDINYYNEANIEAFLIYPIVFVMGLFAVILTFLDLKNEVKRKYKK